MSNDTCFVCKRTGSRVCDGHCGLCMASDEPMGEDAHPSERMYDGRHFLPGEDDAT